MSSVIIVGIQPHSTTLLHIPDDGAAPASVSFFDRLNPRRIVEEAHRYFGVTLDVDTVNTVDMNAQPPGVILPAKSLPYSYAIRGTRQELPINRHAVKETFILDTALREY